MSRYKVSRYIGLTPQVYDVIGPDNQVIARMWSSNEEEIAHLARFIEAHDEIVDALRSAANELHEWDAFHETTQIDALIERIEGEEAQ